MPEETTNPGGPRNGVVEHVDFEETGKVLSMMAHRVAGDEDEDKLVDAMERLLVKRGGGGGDGDDPGERYVKEIRRHKWIAAVMALILGPTGMVGAYYAIRDRSIANASGVEALKKQVNGDDTHPGIAPRVLEAEESIRLIKVRVGTIDKSMKSIETSQTAIQGGIEELKAENVKRLEDELSEARRELRRRDRANQ